MQGGVFGARGGSRPDNPNKRPLVWREQDRGWTAFANRSGRAGTGLPMGIGCNGKVYMVGANGECGVYDYATQTLAEYTGALRVAGNATNSAPTSFWMHSSGAMLVSGKLSTDATYSLYRSTDLSAGWTKVLDIKTFFGTTDLNADKVRAFAELPNGWIVGCLYGTADLDSDNTSAIIRSKDAGVTWEALTGWNRATYHPRHMHFVTWDPYRNVLWCGGGDGLAASKVGYSTDYGTTWHAWENSWQAVGVVPLENGVLLLSDHNAQSYSAHYVAGKTLAEVLAVPITTTTYVAYNPATQHPIGISAPNLLQKAGFAWVGWKDPATGVVAAAWGEGQFQDAGVLAGSCEEDGTGKPWHNIEWDDAGSSWFGQTYGQMPNEFLTGWDGWMYSYAATGGISRWRCIPPDWIIHVHPTEGTAWGSGAEDDPINYLPDGLYPQPRKIKLLADWPANAALGAPGLVVDCDAYTLGADVSGTLSVDEGFEGGSLPTNWSNETVGGGALPDYTHAAAPSPHGGSRAVKGVIASTTNYACRSRRSNIGLTALTEGQDHWIDFWYYLDEAAFRGACNIANWVNGGSIQIGTQTDRQGTTRLVLKYLSQDGLIYGPDSWTPVEVPLQTWFRVTARCRFAAATAPYAGQIQIWLNNRQVLNIHGLKTWNGSDARSFAVGITNAATASGTRTAIWDDVKASLGTGAFDPRKPTAHQLYGSRQLILPDGVSA